MQPFTLEDFVRESNKIEGIIRDPSTKEMNAHNLFLGLRTPYRGDLVEFVSAVQSDAVIRNKVGLNVMVGNYMAPKGGPGIMRMLDDLLNRYCSPRFLHTEYERIHPFTDGNGRSGRVLWLHKMGGIEKAPLGFLHTFYYQTLVVIEE